MLKKFILNSLSSFVGAWIAFALFGVAFFIVLFAVIGKFSGGVEDNSVKEHSILTIELKGIIEEVEKPATIDYGTVLQGEIETPQTLNKLVKAISEASVNKNIDAIYLKCGGVAAAPATLHALRKSLFEFKKSGKKIYAYGDSFGMGDYYVGTIADSLYMNPEGSLALTGISSTSLYFKDLLDKLGIEVAVVKVGTFKSAVEPYISNEMSQPARAQLDTLYGSMWNFIRDEIASSRKINSAEINRMIDVDFLMLQNSKYLLKKKLIDRTAYERQMDGILADCLGRDKKKLNFVSPETLVAQNDWGTNLNSKNQVAVLYATGEIAEKNTRGIDCYTLVPIITELADNENVKGLVLRVNSPGGSVFGSEQIAEALKYFKSKGKPLAVSMGDYAASGGYWISADADRIFADPLTITGSIGIFGLIPNISGLANKIGVHPQSVSTNPEIQINLLEPLTPRQHEAMQKFVEDGYNRFISRVSKGRHLSEAKVRALAEGRVWSAITAKKLGLVDELGTLNESVEWVVKKGKIGDNYDVAVYPKQNMTLLDYVLASGQLESLSDAIPMIEKSTADKILQQRIINLLQQRPVQARMPLIEVKL
ncbi:MAG: signal peptide peptidase SppA [Muribaculaceae bacterium]|nr:signal peptide peptidase SppA [Muribaculaceae bacterium]